MNDPVDFKLDFNSKFYKNCARRRKEEAKICGDCPFREWIETQEKNRTEYLDNLKKNPHIFKRELLGEWTEPECSVMDNNGVHCPAKPVHFFRHREKDVGLCERCFEAYNDGAFDYKLRPKK